jgi:ribonuclease-3
MIEERGQEERLGGLEAALGYRFKDRSLLLKALTHRSHSHERGREAEDSYERLEFLGDALLGLFVADWLFRRDETAPEGSLSRRRQMVVRTSTLAAIARSIGLGDAIRLGRGEELTGGRGKTSLLADVFEAVLGAVYLDGGFEAAEALVLSTLEERIADSADGPGGNDFKTILQELVVQNFAGLPTYEVVAEGPDHEKRFKAIVYVSGQIRGRGAGRSKKSAEQAAAQQACAALEGSDPGPEHDVDPAVAGGGAR